ncbi:unnamed protein product [Cuscuta epithymum]|uniref:Uncharacterized protein n=1 Tax=Cuscuta epithymum TaxID=186058 RepID=A0AAV0CFE3_9ASTE|nr:unnamed protein product [Cuscuta epithymum]
MEAEQQVLHMQQDASSLRPAFGAHVGHGQPHNPPGHQPDNGAYRGRGGRGRGGKGRAGRGKGRFQHQQTYGQQGYPQQQPGNLPAPQPLAAGGVYNLRPNNAPSGKSVLSIYNINAKSTSGTHFHYAGFSSAEGVLGSVPPPVVCQICFSAGHSALHCSSRFSQPSAPALVAPSGETNDALWYPDFGASAHMTSSEGQTFGDSSSSGAS